MTKFGEEEECLFLKYKNIWGLQGKLLKGQKSPNLIGMDLQTKYDQNN